MEVLISTYQFVLLLAAVSGIADAIGMGDKKPHIKLLAGLVVFDFIAEISIYYWLIKTLHRSNLQAYNFVMLVETMVYGWYYLQIIRSPAVRKCIKIFLCLFPVFWFFVVYFIFGSQEWNSYVYVSGSVFAVLCSLVYLFEIFISDADTRLRTCAEFWIAVGLIIFNTCQIPLMDMFNFILTNFPKLSYNLVKVNLLLNIVMYLLFTYAFLCSRISTKKSLR